MIHHSLEAVIDSRWVVRTIAGISAAAMLVAVALPVTAVHADDGTNGNKVMTSSEVGAALASTPGVLAASDQVKTTSDADSAIQAITAGAVVDVPKDPSEGVTLATADGSKPAIDISLPSADAAADAKQVAPGTVAYPAGNGSANAVQATEDGGVRMLTVIDNPSAPTTYDYKITVPQGGYVTLTSDGGAVVIGGDGALLIVVSAPWAKDANGVPVRTYYSTDGASLTQRVEHNVAGVAYPVTADPSFRWGWSGVTIYLSRSETRYASGLSYAVLAGFLGLSGWPGAAVAGIGYTADWAWEHSGYCMAVYRPYVWNLPGYGWAYRC